MSAHTYRTVGVPVDGGTLHVGLWEPPHATSATPTVVAVHGITATHRSWDLLPPLLRTARIVAPDLRGRGRSNGLPGPYGLARHAEDIAAALTFLDITGAVALGHSMGAFVTVLLADSRSDLVDEVVLVDGGLPLEVPADADPDELMQTVLGPAVRRLAMTFPDIGSYREFWSAHPAFGPDLVAELTGYFDYDLDRSGSGWQPSCRIEAVVADQRELVVGDHVGQALTAIAQSADHTVPITFIHAPRGLLDDAPLYRPAYVRDWARRLPSLSMVWGNDVNHYTVVMSARGVRLVTQQLAPAMEGIRR